MVDRDEQRAQALLAGLDGLLSDEEAVGGVVGRALHPFDRRTRLVGGGEQARRARLGFAVVAHLDPEILLIDEALVGGDSKFKEQVAAGMWAMPSELV